MVWTVVLNHKWIISEGVFGNSEKIHTNDSICLTSSIHKTSLTDLGLCYFHWKICIRGKTSKLSFRLFLLSLSDFFSLPSPHLSGTAGSNHPGEGGRGQRWKQAGAWSHLWDQLPLGRLHPGVWHPGAAGARKWERLADWAFQLRALSAGSAPLTLHCVEFLS